MCRILEKAQETHLYLTRVLINLKMKARSQSKSRLIDFCKKHKYYALTESESSVNHEHVVCGIYFYNERLKAP